MPREHGRSWIIRAHGEWAHFGGIPFGPERCTMMAPSRSAVVGVLRSILGKWESRWEPLSVRFLHKPDIVTITQNQLKSFQSEDFTPIDTSKRRTQRNWTFLKKIDLVIEARITRSPTAGLDDTIEKFDAMIERRLKQGYRHHQPYFGTRECTAHLTIVEDPSTLPPVVNFTQDMGLAFYDLDIDAPDRPAYLAPLRVKEGIVIYPSFEEVRQMGLRFELARVVAS